MANPTMKSARKWYRLARKETKTGFEARVNGAVVARGTNLCDVAGLARPDNGIVIMDLSNGRRVDARTVAFYAPTAVRS